MADEDRDILARIGHLAGQINRHKSQQAARANAPNAPASTHRFTPYGGRGRSVHRGGRFGPPHRHRTLVLNGGSQTQGPGSSCSEGSTTHDGGSWVSKTDRHLQLINSTVFEKESANRAKAIEESRKKTMRERDNFERSMLMSHFTRATDRTAVSAFGSRPNPSAFELEISGIRFRVAKNGSKLVRIPDQLAMDISTPKTAVVGGVKFYRSKNGNLYRGGVVKAQRQYGTVKKIDQPCRIFSSSGSCPKGPTCRYQHDASKVAICKDLLLKGNCIHGESCDLSHDATPERTPNCLHYAKGNCTNPNCPYTHSDVLPSAPVCRAFGFNGYCADGAACAQRHVFECPDFSNMGQCKVRGCKLPHRERASVLRKTTQREGLAEEDQDDLSSDQESYDSNDVDSDEVEEFIGDDGVSDVDFREQKDFIAF